MGIMDQLGKEISAGIANHTGGAQIQAGAAPPSGSPQPNATEGGAIDFISAILQQVGGVNGLLQLFQLKGLGNLVQSWIGSGQNLPISAQQIVSVIGQDRMTSLAGRFGMTPEQAQQKITTLLPQIVDRLTPDGQATNQPFSPEHLVTIGKSFFSK